jgi:dimethylargininase
MMQREFRRRFRRAVVRGVPDSFVDAIRPAGAAAGPIDARRARVQHQAYVDAFAAAGVKVSRIAAAERYPDCCFVEDPAIAIDDIAVMCRMATPSRKGEGTAVEKELSRRLSVLRMQAPATMDGGDVLRVGNRLFVGLTERTNTEAVQQLRYSLGERYPVTPVEVHGVLHLKSACSSIGPGVVLLDPDAVDPDAFRGLRTIAVPRDERYAANCLAVNDVVLMSAGHPRTRELLAGVVEEYGLRLVELDMGEFRKAGGSLTCLSILL